jgi:hypothetical protein
MNEVEASLLDSDFGDNDARESQATSIELGDNFVVICNELENGIHFMLSSSTSPYIGVRKNLKMIGGIFGIRGICFSKGWYYRVEGQQGMNFSHMMLTNVGPTFVYSHFVVGS